MCRLVVATQITVGPMAKKHKLLEYSTVSLTMHVCSYGEHLADSNWALTSLNSLSLMTSGAMWEYVPCKDSITSMFLMRHMPKSEILAENPCG